MTRRRTAHAHPPAQRRAASLPILLALVLPLALAVVACGDPPSSSPDETATAAAGRARETGGDGARAIERSRRKKADPRKNRAKGSPSTAVAAQSGAPAAPDTVWTPAAPAPVARVEGPAVVVGRRLFVFGGFSHFDGKLRASTRVDIYDPATRSWSQGADMPTPTTHRQPAAVGTDVWLAGGFEGDNPGPTVAHAWRYDTAADRWERGPDLPAPRSGGAMAAVGRTLHYFGGFGTDRRDTFGDHWALDLDRDRQWRPRAPMPCVRGHLVALVLDGRVHAVGGQHGHKGPHPDLDCHEVYLSREDRWIERAPLPTPRSHFEPSAFVWDGRLVVVGGRNNEDKERTVARVTVYDPATDSWSEAPPLPVALLAPVAAPLAGRLFVTMGSRDDWKSPQTASWEGPLP